MRKRKKERKYRNEEVETDLNFYLQVTKHKESTYVIYEEKYYN